MSKKPICALALLLLAACTAARPPQSGLSVTYYDVSGTTADALDVELRHKGPLIAGKGRALASATIGIRPDVRLQGGDGTCRVATATAEVSAGLTLPRWRQRQSATGELAETWDNFERYAVMHELAHVAIAEQHADRMARELRALPDMPDCAALRARVAGTIREVMAAHGRAQETFDAVEEERIERLADAARRRAAPDSDGG